jgi:CheY-like chemotaxis protein
VTPAGAGHVLTLTEQETKLFHFTETVDGAHCSDRIVIGFPLSAKGVEHQASLGVISCTETKAGSVPEPSAGHPPGTIVVLSHSGSENDQAVLARAFRDSSLTLYPNCRLTLQPSPTLASALALLRTHRIPIVLCDHDACPQAWREILWECRRLPAPPCVIVTSRLAGDGLWMDILNDGAFDLLSKPFDPPDVMRIIHSAWVHWQNRYRLADVA